MLPWEKIEGPDAFESLVGMLLTDVDRKSQSFSWPGKDGAQDAISRRPQDGLPGQVSQASKGQRPPRRRPTRAGQDREYKLDPDHPGYPQWRHVTRWVLVTNVRTQAAQPPKWDAEVVPAFRELELEVELWGAELLETKLAQRPWISRVFFEDETRLFVSLNEAWAEYVKTDPGRHDQLPPTLVGRAEEIDALARQLEHDRAICALVGPTGSGTTRVALEVARRLLNGESVQTVLVANPASLAASSTWYRAMADEQASLIVLDDLDEERGPSLIPHGARTSSSGRGKRWRVLVACRQHERLLGEALERVGAQLVQLPDFPCNDTTAIARETLLHLGPGGEPSNAVDRLASEVAKYADGFPRLDCAGGSRARPVGDERLAADLAEHDGRAGVEDSDARCAETRGERGRPRYSRAMGGVTRPTRPPERVDAHRPCQGVHIGLCEGGHRGCRTPRRASDRRMGWSTGPRGACSRRIRRRAARGLADEGWRSTPVNRIRDAHGACGRDLDDPAAGESPRDFAPIALSPAAYRQAA